MRNNFNKVLRICIPMKMLWMIVEIQESLIHQQMEISYNEPRYIQSLTYNEPRPIQPSTYNAARPIQPLMYNEPRSIQLLTYYEPRPQPIPIEHDNMQIDDMGTFPQSFNVTPAITHNQTSSNPIKELNHVKTSQMQQYNPNLTDAQLEPGEVQEMTTYGFTLALLQHILRNLIIYVSI